MDWAKRGEQRVKAERGITACCPTCGAPLQPKCGEIVKWHWAHHGGDCDPWHENETLWHLNWKRLFPDEWQEVILPPHRADIRTPRMVIELQHSAISPAEIREREAFYGDMIWIFDLTRSKKQLSFPRYGPVAPGVEMIVWQRVKRSIFACRKPVLFHLGKGQLLNVYGFGYHPDLGYQSGFYHAYSKEEFLAAVGATPSIEDFPLLRPFEHVPTPELARKRLSFFPEERARISFEVRPAREAAPEKKSRIVSLHHFLGSQSG